MTGAPQADAAWNLLNMPEGVTELSKTIYSLHMAVFWWCVAIGVAVFGVMIYALVKFRKSAGAVADTSITHSTRVEIIWTVIPVLILVVMAVPAARGLIKIEDMRNTEMTIKVTGYQWRWQYEYLDEGISFFSVLDREHDKIRQIGSGLDPNSVPNYLLNVDKPVDNARFTVWTQEEVDKLIAEGEDILGEDESKGTCVGCGSDNEDLKGDYSWSGSFLKSGTYYVRVEHTPCRCQPAYYQLQVTGKSVSF